jgi:hypothetical protein
MIYFGVPTSEMQAEASHGFVSGRTRLGVARPERLTFGILRWLRLCNQLRLEGGFPTKEGDICLSSSVVLGSEFSARNARSAPVVGDQCRTP